MDGLPGDTTEWDNTVKELLRRLFPLFWQLGVGIWFLKKKTNEWIVDVASTFTFTLVYVFW
jgi:hypothetical protein